MALVFAPVIGHGFSQYDDWAYVTENPVVREGLTLHGLRWALTTFHHSHWHPLTWLSHMVDVELFGLAPGPPHAVNLALHAINAVLVMLFFARAGAGEVRSALVAALFALHPLRVESVAMIADRKDLLCSLLTLLALIAYTVHARRPSWSRLALVAVLTWLAVLAKISAVMIPAALLLLDLWLLRRAPAPGGGQPPTLWRLLGEKALLLAPMVPAGFAVLLANLKGNLAHLAGLTLADAKLGPALDAVCFYLWRTLWPTRLAMPYPEVFEVPLPRALAAAACLALVSGLGLALWRRERALLAGWLWFLLWLYPAISLFDVGTLVRADRYTYLAQIGIAMMLVWGAAAFARRRAVVQRSLLVAALLGLLALSLLSRRYVHVWRDDVTLFTHAARVMPGNYLALVNLGFALGERGKLEAAAKAYDQALAIKPRDGFTLSNRAALYLRHGQPEAARDDLLLTIPRHPTDARMYNLLASALTDLGDHVGALRAYREALRHDPGNANYHYNLATLLASRGDLAGARHRLEMALALDPELEPARRSLAALRAATHAGSRPTTP